MSGGLFALTIEDADRLLSWAEDASAYGTWLGWRDRELAERLRVWLARREEAD